MKSFHLFEDLDQIHLEEGPAWAFLLEWVVLRICRFIPAIPLPAIPWRLFGRDIDWNDGEKWTTLKEWYGNTNQAYCCHMCHEFGSWCVSKRTVALYDISSKSRKVLPLSIHDLYSGTIDKTDTME
jgi:hypothetical protein